MSWWRFSGYEIRDKRICPKPEARLEAYDPWADYERGKTRAGESPPYLSLLNLIDEVLPEVTFVGSVSPALQRRWIENWDTPLVAGWRYGECLQVQTISERALNRKR